MPIIYFLPLFWIQYLGPYLQMAYIAACFVLALFAINRKIGGWGLLFFSILFSPLFGLFALLISGKREYRGEKSVAFKKNK